MASKRKSPFYKAQMRPLVGGFRGIIAPLVLALLTLGSCQKSSEPEDPFPPAQQIASYGSLPRWSADGQKLAFGGNGTQLGIWVYDRTDGSPTRITDASYPHLYDYRWSNSSDKIAFGGAGAAIENTSGIFVVGLDGSDPVRWHETGHSPCWMPGDSGLVFAEEDPQTGTYGLFRLLFADTSLTSLTNGGTDPQYSPTGAQIAYREPLGMGTALYQLKVMTPAGSTTNILADTCAHFCWTGDAVYLVFDYLGSGGSRIRRVPAAGGTKTTIVNGGVEPSVSATGRVAYQRVYSDLSEGIRAIDLTGGEPQPISESGFQPAITPDGSVIAFARNDGIWLVNP